MYLFIDCETTGLQNDLQEPSSNFEAWPRLVQVAYILSDNEGEVLDTNSYMVLPEDFTIPKEAESVHKISTSMALKNGHRIEYIYDQLKKVIAKANFLIGHNVIYDKGVLEAEAIRNTIDISFDLRSFCTMRSSRTICQIKKDGNFKWPTLKELHHKIEIEYGFDFENWEEFSEELPTGEYKDVTYHNAEYDVKITKWCFFQLLKNKRIKLMNIENQITAIRAYLEMFLQADNISHKQIQLFSEKLESLFSTLEGFDFSELQENKADNNSESVVKIDTSFDNMDDDLPF